jgi:hypothetical protein
MRISAARTFDEVLADQVADDPEFRAEWERTTLARAVANAVITYRLDRKLSQRKLAEQLGWKQPPGRTARARRVQPFLRDTVRPGPRSSTSSWSWTSRQRAYTAPGSTQSRRTSRCFRTLSSPMGPGFRSRLDPRPELPRPARAPGAALAIVDGVQHAVHGPAVQVDPLRAAEHRRHECLEGAKHHR